MITIFDLLNPNFYQNLSKFVPIRWQIDPMIQMIKQNWNLDLKNAQFWQKMDFLPKESKKEKLP